MTGFLPSIRPISIETPYDSFIKYRIDQERRCQKTRSADSEGAPYRAQESEKGKEAKTEAYSVDEMGEQTAPPPYGDSDSAKQHNAGNSTSATASASTSSQSSSAKGMWHKVKSATRSHKTEEEKRLKEEEKKQRKEDYERLNMKNRTVFGEGVGEFRMQ